MLDLISRNDPPPITHPGFFYGFVGVALAWQVAFIFIATDPARFRPLMIPSILEKASWGTTVIVLFLQQRMHKSDLIFAGADLLLGILFVIAYFKTSPRASNGEWREVCVATWIDSAAGGGCVLPTRSP
jgi:hypothetical protein